MNKYFIKSLKEFIEAQGEDVAKSVLSNFICPKNKDIELFLKNKAISFEQKRIAITHLVFYKPSTEPLLVGYFTLANKCTEISTNGISNNLKKLYLRFGTENKERNTIQLALPLIAQIGKNFATNHHNLFRGNELLQMALHKTSQAQDILGGCLIYLECEDVDKLTNFYAINSFKKFGKRVSNEIDCNTGEKKMFVQMIRRLR